MTRESPQTCAYVEDFLVDKLKSSSADVKLKVYRIDGYCIGGFQRRVGIKFMKVACVHELCN